MQTSPQYSPCVLNAEPRGSLSPEPPQNSSPLHNTSPLRHQSTSPGPSESTRSISPSLGRRTLTSSFAHMTHYAGGRTGPSMNININNPNIQRGSQRITAEDNKPDRFDSFLLGEGQKKVTEEADTRIPSASIFTFHKEDHTLGNLLRAHLLKSPHVIFAGYKVPHPLENDFILRVQTDGTLTPRAAVMQTCKDIVNDLSILSREFTKEWELRKMVGDGAKADDKGEKDKRVR